MISLRDLAKSQTSIVVVGGVVLGVVLGLLLSISDFDLSTLRTLRNEAVDGALLQTRFNPLGILALVLVAMAAVGICGVLLSWLLPKLGLSSGGALSGADVTRAGKKLEAELGTVLALIRGHITTNDSYAKSLANAQTRLKGLSEAEQVRVVVSLLVAENERMRQDSMSLKSKLEESERQIQSLRSSLSEAEESVLKDPLTDTGNRRCFDATMETAIQNSARNRTPLSLVMCDIDHFKRVNDAFGHQVGDEIIKMFARVIEANIREQDAVIRYGGEEFAIILPMTDQDAAKAIAERVRRQFESKKLTLRETNQKIGSLTASFGVAQYRFGDDLDSLVKRADGKLYDAKSSGRNRVATFGKND